MNIEEVMLSNGGGEDDGGWKRIQWTSKGYLHRRKRACNLVIIILKINHQFNFLFKIYKKTFKVLILKNRYISDHIFQYRTIFIYWLLKQFLPPSTKKTQLLTQGWNVSTPIGISPRNRNPSMDFFPHHHHQDFYAYMECLFRCRRSPWFCWNFTAGSLPFPQAQQHVYIQHRYESQWNYIRR